MKTVLITGANRGIGFEHVRRFAERGAHVFATARSPADAKELKALSDAQAGRIEMLAYDASDAGAPARIKGALRGTPLDLLFANAGASGGDSESF
jgi:NAD(P)-dependent dehydrogenase (short-subunit alcohol dehydrogenase family)